MGRKCGVESCLSDSNRQEDTGVTFHKVPLHPDIRPKWLSLCRIPEDKRNVKVIYICSRHFLRADFCSFKGKKYMLKQGVLPSVFPWSRPKTDGTNKSRRSSNVTKIAIKTEPTTSSDEVDSSVDSSIKIEETNLVENLQVKEPDYDSDLHTDSAIKQEDSEKDVALQSSTQTATIEQKNKTVMTPYGPINFILNERIEALDFNEMWIPACLVEIDYQENEVLIHFEKYSNKYDEWVCMDSARLRPLQPKKIISEPKIVTEPKPVVVEKFTLGERCMASWSDARKFPATVSKIINDDTYEILFDDGFTKVMRGHRILKGDCKIMQSSPLFDPVQGSKQDRRDKKRKINVAELFGKKARTDSFDGKSRNSQQPATLSGNEDIELWTPSWTKSGHPIGIESSIETSDGTRKSVVVPDPRLPEGWIKHVTKRIYGATAGKWETIILSPEGRKFRTRSEIKAYLEDSLTLKYSESMFDFCLHRRSRRSGTRNLNSPNTTDPESVNDEIDTSTCLKIPLEESGYKCPIQGCDKTFRKENLAQMHVKHYHPKYTKFLDSTPNVADLAYARTVGESPGPVKTLPVRQVPPKPTTPKVVATKPAELPIVDDTKSETVPAPKKSKDTEIIKLLNSKPYDTIKKEESSEIASPPVNLQSNVYSDIKLKDLLSKPDNIPKREDHNFKSTNTSVPRPTRIKTLLPVIRTTEPKHEDQSKDEDVLQQKPVSSNKIPYHRPSFKRKRYASVPESIDIVKYEEPTTIKTDSVPEQNIIIEGGEVIKIVQMKREEIINCTCGITEEDGLMIQCELCLCWQHAYCNNIERENQVPEKYVCYICQHPARQRTSKKYFHDQDWLKLGTLPVGSYHSKDFDVLCKRFEKLKKSHDITGGLIELREFFHTLKVKLKIAEAKNHPKLYLWSKPWEKLPLPEKIEGIKKEEVTEEKKIKSDNYSRFKKNELDLEMKPDHANESMLFSLLKSGKEQAKLNDFPKIDISTLIENNLEHMTPVTVAAPIIPQPEAAINSADCRINLLDHIAHSQSLVEERLNDFEKQLDLLESTLSDNSESSFIRTSQTLQMLLRDINTLQEFSQSSSL